MEMNPLDHVPDPGPECMFSHLEEEPESNFTAVTHAARQSNLANLKKYVEELQNFDTNDLQAALEDVAMS
jgi:hypothetical protein